MLLTFLMLQQKMLQFYLFCNVELQQGKKKNRSTGNFFSQKGHGNLMKLYSTNFLHRLSTVVVEQFPDHF